MGKKRRGWRKRKKGDLDQEKMMQDELRNQMERAKASWKRMKQRMKKMWR